MGLIDLGPSDYDTMHSSVTLPYQLGQPTCVFSSFLQIQFCVIAYASLPCLPRQTHEEKQRRKPSSIAFGIATRSAPIFPSLSLSLPPVTIQHLQRVCIFQMFSLASFRRSLVVIVKSQTYCPVGQDDDQANHSCSHPLPNSELTTFIVIVPGLIRNPRAFLAYFQK